MEISVIRDEECIYIPLPEIEGFTKTIPDFAVIAVNNFGKDPSFRSFNKEDKEAGLGPNCVVVSDIYEMARRLYPDISYKNLFVAFAFDGDIGLLVKH